MSTASRKATGLWASGRSLGRIPHPRTTRVTGLTNGVSYTFHVRAVNNGGWASPPSEPATATPNDVTPVPALPLLGQLLLALGLTAAGARVMHRRPRVPPVA